MKDPLQTIQSPYDTLCVKRGASKSDIEKALFEALKRRVPPNLAMAAYNILKNPIELAKFDLLEYNDEVLKQMRPCPLNGELLLHSDNRMSTAIEWERQLKTQFPHPPSIHVLAVLWYHWLLYEGDRFESILTEAADNNLLSYNNISKSAILKSLNKAKRADCSGKNGSTCSRSDCSWRLDCCSSAPQLEIMWEKTIAYWCAFKANAYPDSDSVTMQAKENIVRELHDKLLNFRQKYAGLLNSGSGKSKNNNNGSELVGQYSELEQKLQLEESLSRDMSKAAVRTAKGKVSCGRMMLENMGLLKAMKRQIDEKLKENPTNEVLKRLKRGLSDIPLIELLMGKHKYDEVLEIIEQQSAEDRESQEICVLKCKALFKLGKQQAELKQSGDAMANLERALDCKFPDEKSQEVEELQANIRNELFKVNLAIGNNLVKSANAKLSDAYNKVIIKGQEATPELIADCEEAVKNLQKASQLGSGLINKKDLDSAKGFLGALKSRLPPDIQKWIDRANDAANKQDWDQAINCFTEAITRGGQKIPDQIHKNLAVCYYNRGIKKIDTAFEVLNANAEEHKRRLDSVINTFYAGTCTHYGATAVLNLADGRQFSLCPSCAVKVQMLLSSKPEPTYAEISLLQSGEEDIAEAAEINLSEEHVKQQLREVREFLSKLGHPVPAKKPRKSISTGVHSAKDSPVQQSSVHQTQKKQIHTAPVQKQEKRTTVKELLLALFWIVVALIIGVLLSRFWA